MPIQYPEKPGTILLCDYGMGGFRPPEMVKRRPVVVVSQRKRAPSRLLTVVPLSTSAPKPVLDHHCRIVLDEALPGFPERECWVRADLVSTVAFDRLDLFRTTRDQYGKRKYLKPQVSSAELEAICACLRFLIGL